VNSNLALPPLKTGKWPLKITVSQPAIPTNIATIPSSTAKGFARSREIVVVDRELSNVRRRNDVLGPENEKQVHPDFAISSNPGDTNLNLPTPSYAEHRDGVEPVNPGEVWDLLQFTQHHMS
jgi:hypothetical protein